MPSACLQRNDVGAAARPKLRGEIPTNQQPVWIYDAVRETVHPSRARVVVERERGVAKVIADALGCKENHVTDLADPTRRVPLKAFEIVDIVRASGSFAILDALERQVGRVAFPVVAETDRQDVLQQALAREVTAFGEFLGEIAADMADGRIDEEELRRDLREIDALVARTLEFRALLIAKARKDVA